MVKSVTNKNPKKSKFFPELRPELSNRELIPEKTHKTKTDQNEPSPHLEKRPSKLPSLIKKYLFPIYKKLANPKLYEGRCPNHHFSASNIRPCQSPIFPPKKFPIFLLPILTPLLAISLGSATYSQYLESTTENTKDLSFLLKPARKPINAIIDDFNPSKESFKLLQGLNLESSPLNFSLGFSKQKTETMKVPLNFSYMNTNENIYFVQKNVKPSLFKVKPNTMFQNQKDSDIVVNITDDHDNQKLKIGLDIDYDNTTKIVIGDINAKAQTQVTINNNEDAFLKKKLLDKGNKLIKDSVLDCTDSNNPYPVQIVCSLCDVPNPFHIFLLTKYL